MAPTYMPLVRMLLHEVEQYKLLYIENPLQPEQIGFLQKLRYFCSTPIAGRIRYKFKQMITCYAANISQLDLSQVAGIWESRKIVS